MPGEWDLLPADVQERILAMTLMTPFQGAQVPSMTQVAANARVSKSFNRSSQAALKAVVKQDYGREVVLMRSSGGNACRALCEAITGGGQLTNQNCALLLKRLSYVPAMEPEKADLQFLSSCLSSNKISVTGAWRMLCAFARIALQRGITLSVDDTMGAEDTAGLKGLIGEIKKRYPAKEYLCIALGASADPIAVGLRMAGYEVRYLPFSGIDNTSKFKMDHIGPVQKLVAAWPVNYQKLLLIDAMSSGTALTVMRELLTVAHANLRRAKPEITLFALNQPRDDGTPQALTAQQLVREGKVATSGGSSEAIRYVQERIYSQEYKDGYLGRLFPKSTSSGQTDPVLNTSALTRMVATLVADILK